jgi:Homeodomain-like domain
MPEVAVKKYIVRLSMEERARLEVLISKGKHPAAQMLKARILLKADVSEAGEGWSDSRIVKALDTSEATVFRTRQRAGRGGLRGGPGPQTFPELGAAANLQWHGRACPCEGGGPK